LVRNTFRRTHRWDKVLRDQDELALIGKEDKLLHVLFSTIPEDIDGSGVIMGRYQLTTSSGGDTRWHGFLVTGVQ